MNVWTLCKRSSLLRCVVAIAWLTRSATGAFLTASNDHVNPKTVLSTTRRYATGSYDHPDLPLTQYRNAFRLLETTLEEARDVWQDAQSLAHVLHSLERIDPDLELRLVVSQDAQKQYTSMRHSQLQAARVPSTDPLVHAVEYAVACSDRLGRYSHAATHAWRRVDAIVQQKERQYSQYHNGDSNSGMSNMALLTHPSYRYSYATNVLLRQTSQNVRASLHSSTTSSSASIADAIRTSLHSIQYLQELVASEQSRLDDLDDDRTLRIRRWQTLV